MDNLRASLGISGPKSDGAPVAGATSTLASQLSLMSRLLGSATADLSEVLMHINS